MDLVTRDQIMRLLGHRGLRRILTAHGGGQYYAADDSEDEDEERGAVEFEKVPSEEGRQLMTSGTFGANERPLDSIKRKKRLASRLLRREMGLGSVGRQRARSGLLRQVRRASFRQAHTNHCLGHDTVLESRHNHTLRIPMLLWPIL
jgi:WD repeat-containing protein 23